MGQGCGSGSWKRLNFCGSGSALKKEAGSRRFFMKHGAGMRKLEAVKFFWKRKYFEERSGKRKIFHETWGRDVEAEAGSG